VSNQASHGLGHAAVLVHDHARPARAPGMAGWSEGGEGAAAARVSLLASRMPTNYIPTAVCGGSITCVTGHAWQMKLTATSSACRHSIRCRLSSRTDMPLPDTKETAPATGRPLPAAAAPAARLPLLPLTSEGRPGVTEGAAMRWQALHT
jgi:hypothetical protein